MFGRKHRSHFPHSIIITILMQSRAIFGTAGSVSYDATSERTICVPIRVASDYFCKKMTPVCFFAAGCRHKIAKKTLQNRGNIFATLRDVELLPVLQMAADFWFNDGYGSRGDSCALRILGGAGLLGS